jgi:hypothetical protein
MLPSQFKRLIETLRTHLGAIQVAVQKDADSAAKNEACAAQQKGDLVRSLGIIIELLNSQDQKGDSAYDKSYGQQERAIRMQRRLAIWAGAAFVAALGSTAGVIWQGVLMRRTYTQIETQTQAAQTSAYATCKSVQSAQDAAYSAAQQSVIAMNEQVARMIANRDIKLTANLGDSATIELAIRNMGQTAAMHVHFEAVAEILKVGKEPSFIYPNPPQNFEETGYVLHEDPNPRSFPLQIFVGKKPMEKWKLPELEAVRAGTDYVSVYGRITFEDIFGNPHWTNFCVHMDAGLKPNTHEKCAAYNMLDSPPKPIPPTPINCPHPPAN